LKTQNPDRQNLRLNGICLTGVMAAGSGRSNQAGDDDRNDAQRTQSALPFHDSASSTFPRKRSLAIHWSLPNDWPP
jgi:hypothetical protein